MPAVPPLFERVDDSLGATGSSFCAGFGGRLRRRTEMPAYVQHHQDVEIAPVNCPTCMGFLPMYVREVEPHWSLAKIDFVYECADCGAEVRQTIRKPEPLRH
jgi:hypothetical protein